MNEEVASYFATRYKTSFMSKIQGSEDSPGFWNSKDESGKTYGELLTIECEDYLRQIVIANYLFDRYSKLSRDEKNYIEETAEYTLDAFFDGNKDKFNEAAQDVRKGVSLTDAFAKQNLFPPMLIQMLSVGEKTASLEEVLGRSCVFFDEQVESSLSSITSKIQPTMLVIMGAVIGTLFIAVYSPMLSIMNGLG